MSTGPAPWERPGDRDPRTAGGGNRAAGSGNRAAGSDPEVVLAQALRAMAGGARVAPVAEHVEHPEAPGVIPRLTTGQVVLVALLVGLMLGIAAGIVSLLG